MTDVEFTQKLSTLASTAKLLNEASDALNKVIADVEAKLRAINLGLTVWFRLCPLSSEVWEEENPGTEEYETLGNVNEELGFARVPGGEWGLVKRRVWYRTQDGQSTLADEGRITPLAECSREDRIAALELLPMLVVQMQRDAERALAKIEQAIVKK